MIFHGQNDVHSPLHSEMKMQKLQIEKTNQAGETLSFVLIGKAPSEHLMKPAV